MSKQLNIETGLQEYELNDAVTLKFNPTDSFFVERMYNACMELDKKQRGYEAKAEAIKDDVKAVIELNHDMDAAMREIMNGLFDMDICTPLVGEMNVNALAAGFPIWANIMAALFDEIDDTTLTEAKLSRERVDKYTKKYNKASKRYNR